MARSIAKANRRCCDPSWRSRSSRRRSASAAATIWAREFRSSSRRAWLWACRRSFSRARRAASTASVDASAVMGEVGPVDQHRDGGAAATNVGRAARCIGRHHARDTGRIDEPPVIERVQDLERRVTELSAERRGQLAGRWGGRQLERETRHSLSGLASSQPTGDLAGRDGHECEGSHRPQDEVDRIVREQTRAGSSTRHRGRPLPGRWPPTPAPLPCGDARSKTRGRALGRSARRRRPPRSPGARNPGVSRSATSPGSLAIASRLSGHSEQRDVTGSKARVGTIPRITRLVT